LSRTEPINQQQTKPFHTMNKAELIEQVANEAGISKAQANAAMDAFTGAVAGALRGGDRVTLVGFGTFSVSERAARNGRNPQTGETIKIKARRVPKFKAGKEFSDGLAGGKSGGSKAAGASKSAGSKASGASKAAGSKAAASRKCPGKAAASKGTKR
jgi:DNA-binding protein HU-beta